MANLFAALHSAGGALRAFQDGINVTQNNVNNASTPGYAKQRPTLEALAADGDGLIGGVRSGTVDGSRDPMAERQVRRQLSGYGGQSARSELLSNIETALPLGGTGSIPDALTEFSNAFSALSVTPNDSTARENVIASAETVAHTFRAAADELQAFRGEVDADISQRVETINEIGARLRDYNSQVLRNTTPDAGLEARVYADLEALSELVDLQAMVQKDGTVNVLIGGQYGLVVQDKLQTVGTRFSPNSASITGAGGQDITNLVTGGRLAGDLKVRNDDLPLLLGDDTQPGALNEMAQHFADRVNGLLTAGMVDAATPGVAMFTYTAGDEARTLAVSATFTAGDIATIDPGPPEAANGVALALASLATSTDPPDQVNGLSLTDYYSSVASDIGRRASNARNAESLGASLMSQAREVRDTRSAVSLDEEATRLVELERSYQAAAQTVSVVDELIQTALSILRR